MSEHTAGKKLKWKDGDFEYFGNTPRPWVVAVAEGRHTYGIHTDSNGTLSLMSSGWPIAQNLKSRETAEILAQDLEDALERAAQP